MLRHDNIQRRISLTLCLLLSIGVIVSAIKPDILEALDEITGYDLTNKDMRKYHVWNQGIIPYYIDDFSFDKVLRDRIRSNLDQIGKVTGLRFTEIPQPPEDDQDRWVFFLNRKAQLGCADVAYENFTNDGVQKVVLGYDCIKSEDLAEIILSLVGVPPQHNSPDRDDYITVNWKNILADKHYLFKKMQPNDWMFSKLEYDFGSAGHYDTHRHTLNGAETISPKNRANYVEGGKGLSSMDIKKIRTIYNYISYKGKTHIKVPECSKLFVTGSNFSNYKPATKSDKKSMKMKSHSKEDSAEKTALDMSEEVNSNDGEHKNKKVKKDVVKTESEEQENDTKDKVKSKHKEDKDIEEVENNRDPMEEVDNENQNFANGTKNDSELKTNNEIQNQDTSPELQNNTKKNYKSELQKKLRLKKYGEHYSVNGSNKILHKSDFETSDEGNKSRIGK